MTTTCAPTKSSLPRTSGCGRAPGWQRAHAGNAAPATESEARRRVVKAVEHRAKRLDNTATICRTYDIHPWVLDAHLNGCSVDVLQTCAAEEFKRDGDLGPARRALLIFLRNDVRPPARAT